MCHKNPNPFFGSENGPSRVVLCLASERLERGFFKQENLESSLVSRISGLSEVLRARNSVIYSTNFKTRLQQGKCSICSILCAYVQKKKKFKTGGMFNCSICSMLGENMLNAPPIVPTRIEQTEQLNIPPVLTTL